MIHSLVKNKQEDLKFYEEIIKLLQSARSRVVRTVNQTMVVTYYEIGRLIIEEEQDGVDRAEYGKKLIKELSKRLTTEFGKGFSVTNVQQMRLFYVTYEKQQTLSVIFKNENQTTQKVTAKSLKEKHRTLFDKFNLSWSHYLFLMRIDNKNERQFYEIEAFKNNWSVRELNRQYDTALYTRLALSRNKEEVKKLSEKGLILEKPQDAIKDPYILEFLGLPESSKYSESDLEQALINKLEHFLLELGSGFTFVARQKRISFDDKHFYIDLVFYNRILRSFVLVDLKIGELQHQDLGQMQMYVNFYDREIRLEDENKTIGMVLCQNKSESVIRYTLPEDNEQIFASKYDTVLPNKEELKNLLQEPTAQY